MKICSFYNITRENDGYFKDILFMFDTIPLNLWLGLILTFLTLSTVLKIGHQLLDPEKKSNVLWITSSAFLDQDNFPTNRKYIIVLSLFMSVGLFCAMAYLTNSVSTDLVVVPQPVAIANYDDIISGKIGIVTNKMFPEMEKFKEQDPKSKEYQLSKLFRNTAADPVVLGSLMKKFFDQTLVVVARPLMAESTALYILSQSTDAGIRALLVSDPDASKFTNVFLLHKDTNPITLRVVQTK